MNGPLGFGGDASDADAHQDDDHGGASDAHAQDVDDQPPPYSQYSDEKDRTFKEIDAVYMTKKKAIMKNPFKHLENIPGFIKTEESVNLKCVFSLQTYVMRANMEHVSAKGLPFYRGSATPAFDKDNEFSQDIADLGVIDHGEIWNEATSYYNKAMKALEERKSLVKFA